jgi:DNA-binding MarR family transcriptional regulator
VPPSLGTRVETAPISREAKIEETLGLMRGAIGRALAGSARPGQKEGFPLLQHFALHYIMGPQRGGITQTELAALLGVSPAYVTAMIDKLEAEHLVKRFRDRKDRRRIRLHVTLAGHHFHHRLHREYGHGMVPLFQGWTDEELDTFQSLLRKLAAGP